ncbi:MAG TPA: CmcJ/NvfI family oxidoreductase [Polyangiaceae bacterium]
MTHGEDSGLNDDTVTATLNYLLYVGATPTSHSAGPGAPEVLVDSDVDPRRMQIHNGRLLGDLPRLDSFGFRLLSHDTKVSDFADDEQLRAVYFSEVESLIRAETGAERVLLFDPTRRTSASDAARGLREPVLQVHNDFTDRSSAQPVRDLLPAEAESLLLRRRTIVQVWRPTDYAVESFPLALADARSVRPLDLVIAERRYPNWVGESYAVTYHPDHRWYWFPRMRTSEVLMFKVYDSRIDGRARWVAHSAFVDPTAPAQARPRRSIELRAVAFF